MRQWCNYGRSVVSCLSSSLSSRISDRLQCAAKPTSERPAVEDGEERSDIYICRIILRSRVAVCPPRRSQRRRMCQHSKFAPREYFKHQSETTETKSEDPDSRVASTSTSELILFSANWNINLDTPLLTLPTQSVSPFATLIVCKWTTPSTSPLLVLG